MYIDPFVAGILVTVLSVMLAIFVYAIYRGKKK